ncbi:MAG: hypothetical protein OEZ14_09190 [Acidimicrobiia bacterium]|nr:hypothetical protein [Acidimicrobiia bacterium]
MPDIDERRGWLLDIIIGSVIGGVVGAIVAVNVAIYAGPDEGYEASIRDVFEHNTIIGLVVVAILIGGPLVGIALARRLRRRSGPPPRTS